MAAITHNVPAQRELAELAHNPLNPDFTNDFWWPSLSIESQRSLTSMSLSRQLDTETAHPDRIELMLHLCRLFPVFGIVPHTLLPDQEDFRWAIVRSLLACGGFAAHAPCARYLGNLYPTCPLTEDETLAQWSEAALEAKALCGVPWNFLVWPWRQFLNCLDNIDEGMFGANNYHKLFPLYVAFFILRHVRRDENRLIASAHGRRSYYSLQRETNNLSSTPKLVAFLRAALGFPSAGRGVARTGSPISHAVSSALPRFTTDMIIPVRDWSQPGDVALVTTPLTRPSPSPIPSPWYDHGMTMENLFRAAHGRVRLDSGTDDLVMNVGWNTEVGSESEAARTLAAIPERYDETFPSEVLCRYFPNLELGWAEAANAPLDAYAAVLDAILCAGVMRSDPAYARRVDREFPIIWCLPNSPTFEDSTNQGKTYAVQLLAQTMTPGLPVFRMQDTDSAPDMRALADQVRRRGTLAVDEFRIITRRTHLLHFDNLQTLATGGSLLPGEVLSNASNPVVLRQPLVLNAKAAHVPPDVLNRSLPLYFRQLTEEERGRIDVLEDISSGRAAMCMRLAAVSLVQGAELHRCPALGSSALRFPHTLGLAVFIYKLRLMVRGAPSRSDAEALHDVGEAVRLAQLRFDAHADAAEISGVMSMVESATYLRISLHVMFDGLTLAELETMRDYMQECSPDGVTACDLGFVLRARGLICGLQGGMALRAILSRALGIQVEASDAAILTAFKTECLSRLPQVGARYELPGMLGVLGWRLERVGDEHGSIVRVRLIQIKSDFTPSQVLMDQVGVRGLAL